MPRSTDVVVVGAGVFGAWTALQLRRTGRTVTLLDAFGTGNTRSSSSGATRVLRVGYGADFIYSQWAQHSAHAWRELFREWRQELFIRTGVLWMSRDDSATNATIDTLSRLHVPFEVLDRGALDGRFPQFNFGPIQRGLLEPEAGVIFARRAVQMVVRQAVKQSVDYRIAAVAAPTGAGPISGLETSDGDRLTAGTYVFACGPWLPKLFPAVLGRRIQSTRQEVFFFGAEAGDRRFGPPEMPAWLDMAGGVYGVPDLEGRGLKIGLHHQGPPFDPDLDARTVSDDALQVARMILSKRIPALEHAPLLEARVCQYANSGTGDFLIDQHPDHANVWLVGAGSGHGFKHGPAVGNYVAARLSERGGAEARFTLDAHRGDAERKIF
ncbi:MAG: FAD-dependent oxidoreductase [Acidobacteria bacterium]|nr:FAD-dependent oxidoreductase [Acidobacteriota bacterium]